MALIKSIDELREYVKINKSKDFETYDMFVRDAQEKYIEPYFGSELLEELEGKPDDKLTKQICRALGPFSLALATDEFSINFGESGHTVSRSNTVAPASDAKIEKATASLFERGWQNLDKAIEYLLDHLADYPEWEFSEYYPKRHTLLFENAGDFHDNGMVNIDYSPLTFYHLRMLILRIEKSETFMFVPAATRELYLEDITAIPETVFQAMKAFTGSRVAALHTSRQTRDQRGKPRSVTEFVPLIRPLYDNEENSYNFYAAQAEFWKDALLQALAENNVIGIDDRLLKWNEQNKKIFVANAQRL